MLPVSQGKEVNDWDVHPMESAFDIPLLSLVCFYCKTFDRNNLSIFLDVTINTRACSVMIMTFFSQLKALPKFLHCTNTCVCNIK